MQRIKRWYCTVRPYNTVLSLQYAHSKHLIVCCDDKISVSVFLKIQSSLVLKVSPLSLISQSFGRLHNLVWLHYPDKRVSKCAFSYYISIIHLYNNIDALWQAFNISAGFQFVLTAIVTWGAKTSINSEIWSQNICLCTVNWLTVRMHFITSSIPIM